jgi:DNA-directed RNA polymerase specialized sigma24 family protein
MRLPPRIKKSRLPTVTEAVKRGDPAAINEMIEGHMRLAMSVVKRCRNRSELCSVALFAVVKAVHYIAEGKLTHDSPDAYIATFIHRDVRRAQRRQEYISDKDGSPYLHFDLHEDDAAGYTQHTAVTVEETVNAITKDRTDREIVDLLQTGHSVTEIGHRLALHKGNIFRRIAAIRKRYRRLENE